jgi:hypothetical protein
MYRVYDCCILIEAFTGKNCFDDDAKTLRAAFAELVSPTPLNANNHDEGYRLGHAVAQAVAGRRAMGDILNPGGNYRMGDILTPGKGYRMGEILNPGKKR